MFSIVNMFHDLEIKEYHGAVMSKTVGGKDLSDDSAYSPISRLLLVKVANIGNTLQKQRNIL